MTVNLLALPDVDALVLGRPANIRYVSGVTQLWTSGIRPFAPGCVVIGDQVHLMSVFDGPPDVNLYPMTWNPANLAAALAAIPGLAGASRVGTDGCTPSFVDLLGVVAPRATIVDVSHALWAQRQVKTPAELTCIRAATDVASEGMATMAAVLAAEAGAGRLTERRLLGVFAERVASLGAPILASEGVVCATERRGPVGLRQLPGNRPVQPDQLVVLNPGVLVGGYEGGLGRTVGPAAPQLEARCRAALSALMNECRAGHTGADLKKAWSAGSSGAPVPPVPLAYGIGLGVEPPIVTASSGDDDVLRAGSVLALQSWVTEEGLGGYLRRDLVLVTDTEPELLTPGG